MPWLETSPVEQREHTRYLLACHGLLSIKGHGVRPVFERLFREYGARHPCPSFSACRAMNDRVDAIEIRCEILQHILADLG